ncbi:hypothetical protein Efla_001956 [Eimeria flavescens]
MLRGFAAAARRRAAAPLLLQRPARCPRCAQLSPAAAGATAAAATASAATASAATASAATAATEAAASRVARYPGRARCRFLGVSSPSAAAAAAAASPRQQQQLLLQQLRRLSQSVTWSHGSVLTAKGEGRLYPLYFDAFQVLIPHPSKRDRGGEDAAFCSTTCLVVADGVGGWESSGVDAGIYSKELVKRSAAAAAGCSLAARSIAMAVAEAPDDSTQSPVAVMRKAYLATHAIGSCTCCVVLLDWKNKRINAANLGDSGFVLPSEQSVIARSDFQCHAFNFPLQLVSPSRYCIISSSSSNSSSNSSKRLGVWDNVFDHQVLQALQAESDPQKLAEAVARLSFALSHSRKWCSPFAAKEREFLGLVPRHLGGKPDDISVVVGVVSFAFRSRSICGNGGSERLHVLQGTYTSEGSEEPGPLLCFCWLRMLRPPTKPRPPRKQTNEPLRNDEGGPAAAAASAAATLLKRQQQQQNNMQATAATCMRAHTSSNRRAALRGSTSNGSNSSSSREQQQEQHQEQQQERQQEQQQEQQQGRQQEQQEEQQQQLKLTSEASGLYGGEEGPCPEAPEEALASSKGDLASLQRFISLACRGGPPMAC